MNNKKILMQPKFHTLYKSGQCSPKHELFSDFLVSYDRSHLQPSIHIQISRKCFTFVIWQTIQKCQLFFPSSFNLAQVIFHTLDKNSQCSPKRERKFVLLVALDRWNHWASIDMKKSSKYFEKCFKSVTFFLIRTVY